MKSLSHVPLFAAPWTVTYQAPLTMGFSRQEYWSGLPFPSPGKSSWPRDWTRVSCLAGKLHSKGYDKPRQQHIKKQRHFANKGPYSQSYGFSKRHVWMWELTIKKAEHRRSDAFELWCWRRLLRVPWTTWRANQSILKEKSTLNIHWKDWCWSWNSSSLVTWCEGPSNLKRPWCWERLKTGGEGDDRGWDDWMASLMRWTWVWVNSRSWW